MARSRTLANVAERLGNPLEWSAVAKGILLSWIVVPLYLTYIAFIAGVLAFTRDGILFDHADARGLLVYLGGITVLTLLIGLAGLRVRQRKPDSLGFQYLAVLFYSATMTWLGYQIGSLSLVTGIVIAGAPMVGFIFFHRTAVLWGLALAIAMVTATSLLAAAGQMEYAPLLVTNRPDTAPAMPWVVTMLVVFAGPHMLTLFALSAYVIHRWHRREAEVKQLAVVDPLTGLANRRSIMAELERELERSRRTEHPLAVIMLDLDHFKSVNDDYGHPAGDRVLCTVATVLRETVRTPDRVGRYGGEEFLVLLPDTGAEQAREVAERCRQRLADTPMVIGSGPPIRIAASLGVSSGTGHDTASELIKHADRALYEAKAAGRNQVRIGHAGD